MVKERGSSVENPTDREYVKQQLKAIKREKEAGNETKAQQIANDLYRWLGWE
jgi:hypothetical protein